jgi:hypothetical protein
MYRTEEQRDPGHGFPMITKKFQGREDFYQVFMICFL